MENYFKEVNKMSDVKELLDAEICEELENLKDLEQGTDEYETSVNMVTKLIDRQIELKKLDNEAIKRVEDNDFKQAQLEAENKDRWIRNALTAAGIIIPTGVTIWGTLKTIKFEQTGTVTTIIGRGFFNKLLPKK